MARTKYYLKSTGEVFMPGMVEWLRSMKTEDEAAALRALIEMMPTIPAIHVLKILDGECDDRLDGDTLVLTIRE